MPITPADRSRYEALHQQLDEAETRAEQAGRRPDDDADVQRVRAALNALPPSVLLATLRQRLR